VKLRQRIHTLGEIEKILTYVPMGFIILLMLVVLLVGNILMTHRMESRIALVTQQENSLRQHYLDRYTATINHRIVTGLSRVKERLQRHVHIIEGIYRGLGPIKTLQRLRPYLREMEQSHPVHFVLFDRNMTIHYGRRQLKMIESLIFDRFSDPVHLRITMLYIYSQGTRSSLSWKNDLDQTIQESYFEQIGDTGIYLGAFSRVNNLRSLTIEAYVQSMADSTDNPEGYSFWLYDHLRRNAFNRQAQHIWQQYDLHRTDMPLHHVQRFFLSVGVASAVDSTQQTIAKIRRDYTEKKRIFTVIILMTGFAFLFFARTFSNIIRRILRRYNTQLHHTHERLRRLKERYELAIIASNDGLWDTNFKTRKTFFSQKWLDILGYKPGEIQSFNAWFSLMHPEDTERVQAAFKEHKRVPHPDPMVCEYRLRTKAGEYKWLLGRGKVFWDNDGEPLRLVMMSTDISEQKAASEHLTELVRKEVAKNEEKQRLLIQQNKLAAMGEMIGAIAHQWRQPLNNITLILHFIRDNIDNPDFGREMLGKYVLRAKKQIDYMSETIDDFREFYQPSKSKAPFDVAKAIASTCSIMQTQFEKNSIKTTLSGNSFTIMGYENEFRQAILNILSNAKDAILSQRKHKGIHAGEIRIRLDDHRIRISNNGGQASPEVLERMFEPYFTTKFEDKGTGIGLYMTRTIIENNMEGRITAANIQDGVEFSITFNKE